MSGERGVEMNTTLTAKSLAGMLAEREHLGGRGEPKMMTCIECHAAEDTSGVVAHEFGCPVVHDHTMQVVGQWDRYELVRCSSCGHSEWRPL